MQYWLMKTEPNTYSWNDLVQDTKKYKTVEWDGVRNYEARNNMQAMKKGDKIFIYHSGDKEIVGIAEVVVEAHPDSTDDTGKWECVDIVAVKSIEKSISLDEIKEHSELSDMVLANRGRLSVQPVRETEWKIVLNMK